MSVASQIKTPGQVKGPGSGAGASFSGTSGQITLGDGTAADNVPAGAFDNLSAADMPTGIDAAKIGAGAVSNTEFGYLDGVTSAIQTQLTGKQPAATGTPNGSKYLRDDNSWQAVSATDATKMALAGGVFTGYPIQKIAEVSVANGSWVNLAVGVLSGLLAARFTVLLGGGYGTRSFYWDGSTLTALPDFSNSAIVSGTPSTYGFGLQVSGNNIQGYCGSGYGTVAASLSHFSAR